MSKKSQNPIFQGFCFLLLSALFSLPLNAQSDYDCFRSTRRPEQADQTLFRYLSTQARAAFDARGELVGRIDTPEEVRERGRWAREFMRRNLGENWPPERTPMLARVTGRMERKGYRVEKIVYQSRPGFHVPATLYLPPASMGNGPFPAVLGPCGHSMLARLYEPYQRVYSRLATLGFVVLTYDPPGQGERIMYWDEALEGSLIGGSVNEHSMAGIQCLLTGTNAAAYFIWDGIRGIDYLVSRPEVDSTRIAVTGNSGGGTLTSYITCLDSRVKMAAPTCYVTSWPEMWRTYGMADSEQNVGPMIAAGFGYADYFMPLAPRPLQLNAGIQDFFSIRGARETYRELTRIYGIFGGEESVNIYESDEGHGYTELRRLATYGWFSRHFLGRPGPESEPPMQPEPLGELWSTPTGQVATSYDDAETIQSLNEDYMEEILYTPPAPRDRNGFERTVSELRAVVRGLIRYREYDNPLDIQSRGFASAPAGAASVERLTFEPEPGLVLPALLVRPELPGKGLPTVLYLPDEHKADDMAGDIAALAGAGHTVLSMDLRGKGETRRHDVREGSFHEWFSRDWDMAYSALQLDRPLTGMRALDIIRAVDLLRELDPGRAVSAGVVALAKGRACVPLLHAALLDERIGAVGLEGGLVSWKRMVREKLHRRRLENVVPGALKAYDLPLLAGALAPRPLVLAGMRSPADQAMPPDEVRGGYSEAFSLYRAAGSPDKIVVSKRPQDMPASVAFGSVLGRH